MLFADFWRDVDMKMNFDQITLILLAAGHSRRFGKPKLRAMLHGRMLAHHIAANLYDIPFARRLAVVGADDLGLAAFGFELVGLDSTIQSASLAAGVAAAQSEPCAAIMIALADMPFVPASHFIELAKAFDGERIATSDGQRNMPPAIFGRSHFAALGQLQGDQGARTILEDAPHVVADAQLLYDIDTPEQLIAANQRSVAK